MKSIIVQVLAESMGKPLGLMSEDESKHVEEELWKGLQSYSDAHFYSMYRRLRKSQPDFEN